MINKNKRHILKEKKKYNEKKFKNKCINCLIPINKIASFKKKENFFKNIYNGLGELHFCCHNCKIQWIYKIQKVIKNKEKLEKNIKILEFLEIKKLKSLYQIYKDNNKKGENLGIYQN